jgi:hypothetical protein
MKPSKINRIVWVGIAVVVLGLAVGYFVNTSDTQAQCLSIPCAYYDKAHQEFRGVCGAKKGDAKTCYCFKQEGDLPAGAHADERWASQIQAACKP